MKYEEDLVLNPTTSRERIEMIDALRGFALTGVCLANPGINDNAKGSLTTLCFLTANMPK